MEIAYGTSTKELPPGFRMSQTQKYE